MASSDEDLDFAQAEWNKREHERYKRWKTERKENRMKDKASAQRKKKIS